MTKLEFNRTIIACRGVTKKQLDTAKVLALPEAVRHDCALYVIRNRGPLLVEFVTPLMNRSWLSSMGYLYHTKGVTGFSFIHTGEHVIR